MSMISIHKSALEEIIVPYHFFLTAQTKDAKKLFGFVEGINDISYYNNHISRVIKDYELILIEAGEPGNKSKVLQLIDIIDWNRYPEKQTAFFVDRDLDDFFNGQKDRANLYITDDCSIENSIVSTYTLNRVIKELCNINLYEKENEKLFQLFLCGVNELAKAVSLISAAYIWLQRKGDKPSFNCIEIKDVLCMEKCNVKTMNSTDIVSYIERKWNTKIMIDEVLSVEVEFQDKNIDLRYIRGKYLMWYFVNFINNFHESCQEYFPRLSKPRSIRKLDVNNAINDLGVRSKTPETLVDFISRTYLMFISEACATSV